MHHPKNLPPKAEPPPLYLALQAFLVDLSELPGDLILILDDYHSVLAEEVHQALAYLLRNLPQSCHLVILSRVNPPLPLARLRAEQQLVELRADDLRFTPAETEILLANLLGRSPDAMLVSSLQQQTEGWAIALQLAAMAQMQAGKPDLVAGVVRQQVAEYLAAEVFDQQPAPVQELLLVLAVPARFCAGLGAALLDTPDALGAVEERINQLFQANLMLIPLDSEGRWYRFHHLFRDLLLRRLRSKAAPAAIAALELRAAGWLEAAGLFEEAVRHYLGAGAEEAAARLVERLLLPAMGRDQQALSPDAWLRLLPAALVARRPALLLLQARRATLTLDLDALAAYLEQLDRLLEDLGEQNDPPWPGFSADRAALRGVLHFWQGRAVEATIALRTALAQGPVPWVAVQALVLLGQALLALGRRDEALLLVESLEAGSANAERAAVASFCRCVIHMHAGELAAVTRAAGRLRGLAAALDPIWGCYAEAFLAGTAYERGDLDVAAEHYQAVVQQKDQANPVTYMGSLVALTVIAIAGGDLLRAAGYEEAAWYYAAEVGGRFLRHQAAGAATRLALARDDIAGALRAAEGIGPDIHFGMSLWTITPRLSRIRALLACGEADALEEADALLAGCLAEVGPLRNVPLLAHCLAHQACVRQAQGQIGAALDILEEVLRFAEPGSLFQAFLDCGPKLMPLLHMLNSQNRCAIEVERILAHMQTPASEPRSLPAAPVSHLPELLTRREHEILELLAERWSNQEIAARLVISTNTVRKHNSTIFGKLGVSNRRAAVTTARALGLLPNPR